MYTYKGVQIHTTAIRTVQHLHCTCWTVRVVQGCTGPAGGGEECNQRHISPEQISHYLLSFGSAWFMAHVVHHMVVMIHTRYTFGSALSKVQGTYRTYGMCGTCGTLEQSRCGTGGTWRRDTSYHPSKCHITACYHLGQVGIACCFIVLHGQISARICLGGFHFGKF